AAVGPVSDVLPLAITELAILRAKAPLFPHDENCVENVRNEAAVAIEDGLARGILLHGITLKEQNRAVGKIEGLCGRHRRGNLVAVDGANLPILVVVEHVQQLVRIPVSRWEADAIDRRSRKRLRIGDKGNRCDEDSSDGYRQDGEHASQTLHRTPPRSLR